MPSNIVCRVLSTATVATVLTAMLATPPARADEGMWLFTHPPRELLKERYGFEPGDDWLLHVQRSCVRMNNGGSASFVSKNGLVLTNHHVGSDCIEKLSTPERNLLETGFLAASPEEELRCEDLEVNVLWTIEDVTDRIQSAAEPDMSPAEANTARRRRELTVEKDCESETGMDCQVVTLYHGGRYHLYRYKRFTDVRLAMAPQQQVAFFGGDADNFEYPRFNLDMCLFRVYDGDKPLEPKHYLKWSPTGAKAGDLVFVAGHPGRTRRLNTVAELKFMRDVTLPHTLASLWRREVQLNVFAREGKEHRRMAIGDLHGVENGRKALTGRYHGLLDPSVMARKVSEEKALQSQVEATPEFQAKWGDAWDKIARAQKEYAEFYAEYRTGIRSDLYSIARGLVRLAEELPKPSAERLPEYSDASLDSLYLRLYSPAPIYNELEIDRLESGIARFAEVLGADDPVVELALNGKSPKERAAELVTGTRLNDVAYRKQLAEGGTGAIVASDDPMIQFAAALDPRSRRLRKRYEDEIESAEKIGHEKIAAARFALIGEDTYPDATFTLRLAFGTIKGYREGGETIEPFTTIGGMYERHKERRGEEAFDLPAVWVERKDEIDLRTPYNFVSTADIIGGNSGSPVIDVKGEVVGLIFDGNIQSLVLDFVYTDEQVRAVSVDSRAMIEALKKVYKADALVQELMGR